MALSRVKNWTAEVLTYSDLNAEFNSILNNVSSLITPITFNLTFTDATYDIGASGATRPRDLFLSRNAVVGGTLAVTGATTLSAALTYGGVTLTNAVTGTGKMVLDNTPTLVTPVLGTATGTALTLSGASPQLTLGVLNTTSGGIKFFGSTSGNVTLAPNVAAGASVTVTLPATSVTLNAAGDLTGNTLAAGVTASSLTSVGSSLAISGPVTATVTADVSGFIAKNTDPAEWRGFYIKDASNNVQAMFDHLPNTGEIRIGSTNTGDYYPVIYSDGVASMTFGLGANPSVTFDGGGASRATGGVRIGADSTNNLLDDASTGAGTATLYIGNASINVTSDERLKSNIRPLEDGLAIINALLPIEYDQDEERPWGDVQHYVGFGARHSHKIAPWSVNTQGDTGLPWKMRQEFLMGPVVKAIQQIDERLRTLEARLK